MLISFRMGSHWLSGEERSRLEAVQQDWRRTRPMKVSTVDVKTPLISAFSVGCKATEAGRSDDIHCCTGQHVDAVHGFNRLSVHFPSLDCFTSAPLIEYLDFSFEYITPANPPSQPSHIENTTSHRNERNSSAASDLTDVGVNSFDSQWIIGVALGASDKSDQRGGDSVAKRSVQSTAQHIRQVEVCFHDPIHVLSLLFSASNNRFWAQEYHIVFCFIVINRKRKGNRDVKG